ncbi:MAG: hypothetical protein KJZ54_05925 [Phycisphaerales bacterium]|nr:hypothetical protein [Phycisphaerales bacterium]
MSVICAVLPASSAWAQYTWKAVRLPSDGAYTSGAFAVFGRQPGGYVIYSSTPSRAALWKSGSEEWTDLTPEWSGLGIIYGMGDSGQAGQVGPADYTYHAALWRGTPESAVDLHPAVGYHASTGYGICGEEQVGDATHSATGSRHAALWRGTPESFVDLHPLGAQWSEAHATDGELQGGRYVPATGGIHAVIWNGTAQSAIDLHPPDATASAIRGMAPGVQVGYVRWVGKPNHAALWRGTVASLVDLNPPGASQSELNATDGRNHAGAAWLDSLSHAAVWLEGREEVVDLHPLLGPGYIASVVKAIWTDGRTIYAAGFADPSAAPREAWVWIGTRVETDAPKRR